MRPSNTKGPRAVLNQSRSKSSLLSSAFLDEPAGSNSGIDPQEFRTLLHRLFTYRPTNTGSLRRFVPLPQELLSNLLNGFNLDADEQPATSRGITAQSSSTSSVPFVIFDSCVRDVLFLRDLYERLTLLMLTMQPLVARAADDRLKQLQSESFTAAEAIELLKILARPSKRSSSSSSSSSSSLAGVFSEQQMRSILHSLDLTPGSSFQPQRPIVFILFIRAVVVAVAAQKAQQRSEDKKQRLKESGAPSVEESEGGAAAAGGAKALGLDAYTRDVYAQAFSSNPARNGTLAKFEEAETIEYS